MDLLIYWAFIVSTTELAFIAASGIVCFNQSASYKSLNENQESSNIYKALIRKSLITSFNMWKCRDTKTLGNSLESLIIRETLIDKYIRLLKQ